MLQSELSSYTHEELSQYTNAQLAAYLPSSDRSSKYITDRTAADVERWRTLRDKGWAGMSEVERQEWMGEIQTTPEATKGMYTHRDLNRVENAVSIIVERLHELGYEPPKLTVKTDWTYADNIWKSDMERYLGNVEALRRCVIVYPTTPNTPSVEDALNYETANDIEKILADLDKITSNIPNGWHYSGEIISGEV